MSSLHLDITVLSQSLTPAQKFAIKNALLKVKLQENLSDIRFWGKVAGTQADYFIALSTTVGETISKSFYYSNDEGATFAALPAPDAFVASKAPKIRGMLTGNPAKKHKDPDAGPKRDEDGNIIEEEEGEEEEEEEEEPEPEEELDEEGNPIPRQPPPRKLTELERLSFNVREIENETGVVPKGSWSLSATGAITRNAAFAGLSAEQARKLDSYVLFRDATHPFTHAKIRKAGVINHTDFLDPITPANAKVKGTWALHVSDSGLEVSLRSLLYPGFEYRLEAGTNNFAGGYFGLGEKNSDLLFMI